MKQSGIKNRGNLKPTIWNLKARKKSNPFYLIYITQNESQTSTKFY